tara:strand:- start:17459 stop:18766 length:1308 start_codon:yes stop_codon:yes gene_type:complete
LGFDFIEKINYFDIVSGILLFIYLILFGQLVDKLFSFQNISISIIFYLFSFFIIDVAILFFYHNLSFSQVFVFTNIVWLSYFLIKKRDLKFVFYIALSYFSLNYFINNFKTFLTKNNNLLGDVDAVFFDQALNIYENSYYFSISNYIMEGYPQFISYFQSLFLRISTNTNVYDYYSFTSHIIFYLSILFFFELKIGFKNKVLISVLFSFLILNSLWLQFLFTSSLMSEGIVSLFTAVLIFYVFDNIERNNFVDYLSIFLLGFLYFSKQFNSSIVLFSIIVLIFYKEKKLLTAIGFSGFLLKELLFVFVFPEISKEHHIRQIDLQDTFIDLLILRDLKFENILLILKNLWIDKPITILLLIFYMTFLLNSVILKKVNTSDILLFLLVNLNLILIFSLYISAWQNMELESPIRYILNFFHLTLVCIFLNLKKIPKMK